MCHCWTDKTAGCCASKTGRGTNKTGGGANKTGAASVFDSATNAADSAARVAEAKEKEDKNANSRCRKMFDFDTKKGVCAGNTITKVKYRLQTFFSKLYIAFYLFMQFFLRNLL